MAKKKKPAKPMDAHTRQGLHWSLTKQLSATMVRCEHLRDTGCSRESRR
jgi:hypothetical protein